MFVQWCAKTCELFRNSASGIVSRPLPSKPARSTTTLDIPQPQQTSPVPVTPPAATPAPAATTAPSIYSSIPKPDPKLKETQAQAEKLEKQLKAALECLQRRVSTFPTKESVQDVGEFMIQEREFLCSVIELIDTDAKKHDYHGPYSPTTGKVALQKNLGQKHIKSMMNKDHSSLEIKVGVCMSVYLSKTLIPAANERGEAGRAC